MILNSKQLEELENIQDASGEFEEEASESDGYVEGVENALAWRRGMVERAVLNIRKLVRKPIDTLEGLSNGSLVYLKESKRFVRIHENQDGHTELSFVGPTPQVATAAVKAKAAKMAKAPKPPKEAKAEKPVKKAKATDKVVAAEPAKNVKPVKAAKAEKTAKPVKAVKRAKVKVAKKATEKAKLKSKGKIRVKVRVGVSKKASSKSAATEKVVKKVPLKPKKKVVKVAAKAKTKKTSAKKAVAKKTKPAAIKKNIGKKLPRKSASNYMVDPVADPNGYIRNNFRLMSNKELSHITGLSEHTIRRKLGEWGLKRI